MELKNNIDYLKALERIEQIFFTDDLQEVYELDNLYNLVSAYEEKHNLQDE